MLSQFSYSHVPVVIVVPLKTCCPDDCIDWNKVVLMVCASVEFVFNYFSFVPVASRENNSRQAVMYF